MTHKLSDYPRAMLIDMLEFRYDPLEFGVIHTNPSGYHITWFDGPSQATVRAFVKKEFKEFSKAHVGLSRQQSE